MKQGFADLAVALGAVVFVAVVIISIGCGLAMLVQWIDESDERQRIAQRCWRIFWSVAIIAFIAFVVWGISAGGSIAP